MQIKDFTLKQQKSFQQTLIHFSAEAGTNQSEGILCADQTFQFEAHLFVKRLNAEIKEQQKVNDQERLISISKVVLV